MGAIPWVILSEVFSYHAKPYTIPGALAFFFLISFILTNIFGVLTEAIGIGQTFWIFSIVTVFSVIFEIFVVIETKGTSLMEIQEILGKK
jgi:hypothetical protein